MSEKQPEIPPTVIQDPAMAEEMAYSEKPHTEAAQAAMKAGRFGEIQGHLDEATSHGADAAKRYLKVERAKLDKSEVQLEANLKPEDRESESPETKVDAQEAWEQSLAKLSPEQQETATKLRTEITKRFEKFGMKETDLRIIETKDKEGNPVFTLLHTGQGIDIGNPKEDYDPARSYKEVMSKDNDKLFVVEIDGKTYDTREGMTEVVYQAKYQDAKDRGVSLPDSKQLSEETGDLHTWTMLTGEPLTADGFVQLRGVSDGPVYRYEDVPTVDYRVLRVCPAVVINL